MIQASAHLWPDPKKIHLRVPQIYAIGVPGSRIGCSTVGVLSGVWAEVVFESVFLPQADMPSGLGRSANLRGLEYNP